MKNSNPSVYACPECHGVLWEVDESENMLRFRCRVGHAYSAGSLAVELAARADEALWTALRALEERAALSERLAERARKQNNELTRRRFVQQHQETMEQADVLRLVLSEGRLDAVDHAHRDAASRSSEGS